MVRAATVAMQLRCKQASTTIDDLCFCVVRAEKLA
jgi:hypothetical protein